MSESFEIQASQGRYTITIGHGLISAGQLPRPTNSGRIIDQNVATLWPATSGPGDLQILAIEDNKTLETVAALIGGMRAQGLQRASHLYALGGGIVQDLATFAASCYMRGITWSYCPTTLLGMVDSCIGGKSSINVAGYKNIAGNIYPPTEVLIDVAFCSTLAPQEHIAGLCEAVKICFASRTNAFDRYMDLCAGTTPFLTPEKLEQVVVLSLGVKKVFVEEDEFDKGVRLLLNFGHTFGHAIEAASHFSITHGVAVGLGMLAELELARALGLAPNGQVRIVRLETYLRSLLAEVEGLAHHLAHLDLDEAVRSLKADKKHGNGLYSMILAQSDGFLERGTLPVTAELDARVRSLFARLQKGELL